MGLLLVANPGSASRKYALYSTQPLKLRANVHYETEGDAIVCHLDNGDSSQRIDTNLNNVAAAATDVLTLLEHHGVLKPGEIIQAVGLRVVAPSEFFLSDHLIDDTVIERLEAAIPLAPIHIQATMSELKTLRQYLTDTPIVAISDSAFHKTKPNYAWNYGINIHDADTHGIKRYGYHGISVSSAIDTLWQHGKLPPKVIVCHLGSGSSVTAVFHGRSIDNTMGFTPLEGVLMATRSGDISPGAVRALQDKLGLDWPGVEQYLNQRSGLLGIGDSSDIRELITREADGDHMAHLALTTLVHSIHKAIGSMLVALNGADLLVFTGTVGERSAILRKRIVAHLEFTDFIIDGNLNASCTSPENLTSIAQAAISRPIIVIPTNENLEIARRTLKHIK